MNRTAAVEWLTKAWHDISYAKVLYEANHYTDVIGVDLHYAIEKILKTFLAHENKKILRSHNLLELYRTIVKDNVVLDNTEINGVWFLKFQSY